MNTKSTILGFLLLLVFSFSTQLNAQVAIKQIPMAGLIDVAPCISAGATLRFVATGLASDEKCTWTVLGSDLNYYINPIGVNRATIKDTIELTIYSDFAQDLIVLTLSTDQSHQNTFSIKISKEADVPLISYKDTIFCQDFEHKFSVLPDPKNNPAHSNYYGRPIKYNWTVYNADGGVVTSYETDSTNIEIAMAPRGAEGSIRVQAVTCPTTKFAMIKPLSPFIKKPPVSDADKINRLGYYQPAGWAERNWWIDSSVKACTWYSSSINNTSSQGNTTGKYNGGGPDRGYGDGYIYLQLGSDTLSEKLVYDWTWDPNELEFDPSVYNLQALKDGKFDPTGKGYRICLKVKENTDPDKAKSVTVKVKARCPACDTLGGEPYKSYNTKEFTLVTERLDSIEAYDNFMINGIGEDGKISSPFCAGTIVNFTTKDIDGASRTDLKDLYNITHFLYSRPSPWTLLTPPANVDMSYKVEVNIPGVTDTSQKLIVYPMNACFRNLRAINADTFPIVVTTTPPAPMFKSTTETWLPISTPSQVLQEKWKDKSHYLLCDRNSSIPGERDTIKSARPGEEINEFLVVLPNFMKGQFASVDFNKIDSITSEVVIKLNTEAFDGSLHAKEVGSSAPLGFYATNGCGKGDTSYFGVFVIDTLPVYAPIMDAVSTSALPERICEGAVVSLRSDNNDYKAPFENPYNPPTNSGSPQTEWKLADTWNYAPGQTSSRMPVNIKMGSKPGVAQVRFGNKCGWSSYRSTEVVTPYPFLRNPIYTDDLENDTVPCQASSLVYKIDTSLDIETYEWTFPSDWKVGGTDGNIATTLKSDALASGKNYMSVTVEEVGKQSGVIQVIGKNPLCCPDPVSYWDDSSRVSLKVNPRLWTLTPEKFSGFSDTLCAYKEVEFKIKSLDQDTVSAVYYTWHARSQWTLNKEGVRGDSVYANVPLDRLNKKDTIVIRSHRSDCELSNKGDSLMYIFYVTDSASLIVHDAKIKEILDGSLQDISTTPCEGDTVYYFVDKTMLPSAPHIHGIDWTWNNVSDWKRIREDESGDTLVMKVGKDPIDIFAAARNYCEISKTIEAHIEPVKLIVEFPIIEDPLMDAWVYDSAVCNQENLSFSIRNAITNATEYIWQYPWGKGADTIEGVNVLDFTPLVDDYVSGYVIAIPSNRCGIGPADSVLIKQVLLPPSRLQVINEGVVQSLDTAFVGRICRDQSEVIGLKRALNDSLPIDIMEWIISTGSIEISKDILSIDGSDSVYLLKKVLTGVDSAFVKFTAKWKVCNYDSDSVLYVVVPGMDTAYIPTGKVISDYFKDALGSAQQVDMRPCASSHSNTKYYFDNKLLDNALQYTEKDTLESYAFKFRKHDVALLSPVEADATIPSQIKIKGTNWILSDDAKLPDTIVAKVGQDTLFFAVEAKNRCGTSVLQGILIEPTGSAPGKAKFRVVDSTRCLDEVSQAYILNIDNSVSRYVWISSWQPNDANISSVGGWYRDTLSSMHLSRKFKVASDTGRIYVIPLNGCTDSLVIRNLLNLDTLHSDTAKGAPTHPPKELLPINFSTTDTLCLRQDFLMNIKARPEDNLPLRYHWYLDQVSDASFVRGAGLTDTFAVFRKTQDISLPALSTLGVSARVEECTKFGDTLKIDLTAFDTVIPLGDQIWEYVFNAERDGQLAKKTFPCESEITRYYIQPNHDWTFYQSIDSTRFYWNDGRIIRASDSTLDITDWKSLYGINMPIDTFIAKVGKRDLWIQPQAHNRCGWSRFIPMQYSSWQEITEKPILNISPKICLGDDVRFTASLIRQAAAYVWFIPWNSQNPSATVEGMVYTDTTYAPEITFTNAQYFKEGQKIWVKTINPCHEGPSSDTTTLFSVKPVPHRVSPDSALWQSYYRIRQVGDTVFDTICKNGMRKLGIKAAAGDTLSSLKYQWVADPMIRIIERKDSVVWIEFDPAAVLGNDYEMKVAVAWKDCPNYGDILNVKLHIQDTIFIDALKDPTLGEFLMWVDPAPEDILDPDPEPGGPDVTVCVEQDVVLRVGQDKSPAYRWVINDPRWIFKPYTDTTGAQIIVQAKVGGLIAGEVNISVAPTTDPLREVCTYSRFDNLNSMPTTYGLNATFAQPLAPAWISNPLAYACAGDTLEYVVEAKDVGANGYRWIFPDGWKIIGEVKDTNAKDIMDPTTGLKCKVRIGKDSGMIYVHTLKACDNNPLLPVPSDALTTNVASIDTAFFSIDGLIRPCIDSSADYYALLQSRFTASVEMSIVSTDQAGVEPVWNKEHDTAWHISDWKKLRQVELKFISSADAAYQCPRLSQEIILSVRPDTVPEMKGEIKGSNFICMNAEYTYRLYAETKVDGQKAVGYTWEVPTKNAAWRIIEQTMDGDTAVLKVLVGTYTSGMQILDTLRCYPRAACGTAMLEIPLTINIPDTLREFLYVLNNDINPCEGTQIRIEIDSTKFKTDTITFYWFAPSEWNVSIDPNILDQKDSTKTYAYFNIPANYPATFDTVSLRALRNGSCGLSAPAQIGIQTKEKPNTPEFGKALYPCKNSENIALALREDLNTDSIQWTFPIDNEYDLFSRRIQYDSAVLAYIGENPIKLVLLSKNKCGSKEDTIFVTPVNQIDSFEAQLQFNPPVCMEDTTFVQILIPIDHLQKGAEYQWTLPESYTHLFDSIEQKINRNDTSYYAQTYFVSGRDDGLISVIGGNACAQLKPVETLLELYKIFPLGQANPTEAGFRQADIMLFVPEITPKTLVDYDYKWSPESRLKEDLPGEWTTKELVLPIEYFTVVATDIVNGCKGFDTVEIPVKGSFKMEVNTRPYVCISDSIRLFSYPSGGDTDGYTYLWSEEKNGEYIDLAEEKRALQNVVLSVDTIGGESKYYRLISCNTISLTDPVIVFTVCDTQYLGLEIKWLSSLIEAPSIINQKPVLGSDHTLNGYVEGGSGEYVYEWSPFEIFRYGDTSSLRAQTMQLFDDYTVIFTVRDTLSQCISRNTLEIILNDEFGKVPNAFSPNGDGVNDLFMPGVDLLVLNRMGVEIFRSKEKEGWDGTYQRTGKPVEKDDYLYVVTVAKKRGALLTRKGTVTVFR